MFMNRAYGMFRNAAANTAIRASISGNQANATTVTEPALAEATELTLAAVTDVYPGAVIAATGLTAGTRVLTVNRDTKVITIDKPVASDIADNAAVTLSSMLAGSSYVVNSVQAISPTQSIVSVAIANQGNKSAASLRAMADAIAAEQAGVTGVAWSVLSAVAGMSRVRLEFLVTA